MVRIYSNLIGHNYVRTKRKNLNSYDASHYEYIEDGYQQHIGVFQQLQRSILSFNELKSRTSSFMSRAAFYLFSWTPF